MGLYGFLLAFIVSIVSCGGTQMTKRQKKLCVSDISDAELEERFLNEEVPLPHAIDCLSLPAKGKLRISSHFRDRNHAFRPGAHAGTDYPLPAGTEILAVASGTVVFAEATEYDVNIVEIDMSDGWKYKVLHLTKILVKKGDRVCRGQVIGLSGGAVGAPGSGPCTTGPHLHISVSYKGKYTNYEKLLCERSFK